MVSALQEQRDIIVGKIKDITRGDWKVLVIDEGSKKIIDNVVKEDDILNHQIANIERIEEKRPMNPDMDAIYILSPQPHIVDCLMADFERRRYRRTFLVWTTLLDPQLRRRIDGSPQAKQQLAGFDTLSVDFFPKESHLITFRDPWSFPILYHPSCNNLVAIHMQTLAQKITGVCVSLGEYPKVRYYRPRNPEHEASVLCSHLARFVQEELDAYAQYNRDFPPPSSRPQGVLLITDRSMDLRAPLVHEFTYQAMAHDLLKFKETEKTYYKTIINEGTPTQEEKEMEISEQDEIWVKNRHQHMKDTIEKLMGDFQKFMDDNPHFANSAEATSLGAIKDMLVGLPQFQGRKELYSLHLSMAQECMNIFQNRKLPDVASVEQSLATGLDEDYKKPKNIANQVVQLLDDESIVSADRLRLIILYILYRDGVIPDDVQRLLAHSALSPQHIETVQNLQLLGGRCLKALKDTRPPTQPLFPRKTTPTAANEEYALSRYEPMLKLVLEDLARGTLDPVTFSYTKPPLDQEPGAVGVSQASLRSAKPTWAQNRSSRNTDHQQRIIVFVAGGATYSESRACYETSLKAGKDIFLASSHMLTPALFVRQVSDLSQDRRRLDLPVDRPKPQAPAHLFEREQKPQPLPTAPAPPAKNPRPPPLQPPTAGLSAMTLNSQPIQGNGHAAPPAQHDPRLSEKSSKLEKKQKDDGDKKKHRFLGLGSKK